jgi:predicted transport protein
MDQAEITMIDNLYKNTGISLEEWIEIVRKEEFVKHGEIVKFLKEKHAFTHGFANLVAHKSKGSDAGSKENKNELITQQYSGKEHFIPVYNLLMNEILKFGNDIEIAPKVKYVSLKRKKQFAILQPATKTRFEIGLNLKGQDSSGKLETISAANSMCSHKINLNSEKEIDTEVINWLKSAYNNAG